MIEKFSVGDIFEYNRLQVVIIGLIVGVEQERKDIKYQFLTLGVSGYPHDELKSYFFGISDMGKYSTILASLAQPTKGATINL